MNPHPWTAPPGTTGLIFDCDGTLADTMPAHYKAWTAMLDRYGIPFPEPRFYAMGGMPTAQHHSRARRRGRRCRDGCGRDGAREGAGRSSLTWSGDRHRAGPGVATAYRGKLPIAVASGGYRDTITRTLDRHRHSRLVRRDGDGRGHAAAQAGAGRVPGSGPPARRGRRPDAWCSRTPTSAWKRPGAGMLGVDVRTGSSDRLDRYALMAGSSLPRSEPRKPLSSGRR